AIAVDGATGIPLQVSVTARGASSPAFSAGFSSFTPEKPDSSVFAFAPPKGATVSEQNLPSRGDASHAAGQQARPTVSG
ncbi:hypothetical protein SB767_35865, partial [Bacillus sp. SIMBA_069]